MNPHSIIVQQSSDRPEQLILLFHGMGANPQDETARGLRDLGGDVTADVIPFAGHESNAEIAELAVERLSGHVPGRIWEAAPRTARELPRS